MNIYIHIYQKGEFYWYKMNDDMRKDVKKKENNKNKTTGGGE